ncbi:MAG TPA: S9 family peptidase [Micromonosporaceae bacterium]|nr:S9 family peptidase [Micromonosporaceae bacterium]
MTDSDMPQPDNSPFHQLDDFIALPRVSGLVLSPDGSRLITSVATLDPKKTRYVNALWEVDPAGVRPARRLTRSAKGESGAAFLPDGSIAFVSARPDPAAEDSDDEKAALWQLPAGGGEARVIATRPGGVSGVVVAAESGTILVSSATLPGAVTREDDEKRRKERKDRKVSAILHETYPIRYWDHDIGPDSPRLFVGARPSGDGAPGADPEQVTLQDITPDAERALASGEPAYDITPDGTTVISSWALPEQGGSRDGLVVIDVASGERRVLLGDPDFEYGGPRISPDGATIAVSVFRRDTADTAPDIWIALVDLATGDSRDLTKDWDRWPSRPVWTPDGSALIVSADDGGGAPLFRVDATTGAVARLTGDQGAYSDPQVSPDGRYVYAMRAAIDAPPAPVRVAASTPNQQPTFLNGPAPKLTMPGTLNEVTAIAEDGSALRAWLVLPDGASAESPAPLLLWIHGGPLGSWNAWAWRWNPWLAAAQGYAVLLPDPALSTGYGWDFIQRGWGSWGGSPYTDLMRVTDAAEARDDIDATRTGAMGGSFGGYMANWVAGHTDRFKGIVTHASLWALDQFGPTTDAYHYWRRELTPERALANSPHRHVDAITTPMLVIHGDRDYRVPIGEGLRLWAELSERHLSADGTTPHKFLYFPDENHWVLSPQHAKVWYDTVFAFLTATVLGGKWQTPEILR